MSFPQRSMSLSALSLPTISLKQKVSSSRSLSLSDATLLNIEPTCLWRRSCPIIDLKLGCRLSRDDFQKAAEQIFLVQAKRRLRRPEASLSSQKQQRSQRSDHDRGLPQQPQEQAPPNAVEIPVEAPVAKPPKKVRFATSVQVREHAMTVGIQDTCALTLDWQYNEYERRQLAPGKPRRLTLEERRQRVAEAQGCCKALVRALEIERMLEQLDDVLELQEAQEKKRALLQVKKTDNRAEEELEWLAESETHAYPFSEHGNVFFASKGRWIPVTQGNDAACTLSTIARKIARESAEWAAEVQKAYEAK